MGNWQALLLGPSVALVNLSMTYALVTPSCAHQTQIAMHHFSAASLLPTLFFTLAAWNDWRRQAPVRAAASDDEAARGGFVALVAAMVGMLSVITVITVIVQWIPQWVLSPCAS